MNNGKLALRLVFVLFLVFVLSALIFLISRSSLHEWAIAIALSFAAIVGSVTARFVFKRGTPSITKSENDL